MVNKISVQIFVLVLLVAVVFAKSLGFGFIWDDFSYVINNPLMRKSDVHQLIWLKGETVDFWPISWSLFAILYRWFGNEPLGYHAFNIVVHAMNAGLLLFVLRRTGYKYAFAVAALFAIHPVTVDTVVWMFQAKTTVSVLFGLVSLWMYFEFETSKRWHWLTSAVIFFIFSLLTKTTLVTAPVALLAYAIYRGRYKPWELVPFFIVSAVIGYVASTWYLAPPPIDLKNEGMIFTLGQAAIVPMFYIWKILIPYPLSFSYEDWRHALTVTKCMAAFAAIGILLFGVFRYRTREWVRWSALHLACFVILLIPVLGFFKIYFFRYSPVSDHWQYHVIPFILVLIVSAAGYLVRSRRVLQVMFVAIVTLFSVLSFQHSEIYRNEENLWIDTIRKNPTGTLARNNYGVLLLGRGAYEEAKYQFEEVIANDPDDVESLTNLGVFYTRLEMWKPAQQYLEKTIQLHPNAPKALYNLGIVYAKVKGYAAAIPLYEKAMALDPKFAEVRNNLGMALLMVGRDEEAKQVLEYAIQAKPEHGEAHYNYGTLLEKMGHRKEALQHYQEAHRLLPNNEVVQQKLSTFKP